MDDRPILHLVRGLEFGGMERVVLDLARASRRLGHDHRIVTYDVPPGGPGQFESDGIDVTYIERGAGVDLGFARRLREHIARTRPAAVHAHGDSAAFYLGIASLGFRGQPPRTVATFHAWPSHATWRGRWATRVSAARLDMRTAVSEELRERLERVGWVRRVTVVPNGVDTARFKPGRCAAALALRRELGVGPNDRLVVHAGRFDPIKRHEDLLDAAQKLAAATPPVVVACVGHGTGIRPPETAH